MCFAPEVVIEAVVTEVVAKVVVVSAVGVLVDSNSIGMASSKLTCPTALSLSSSPIVEVIVVAVVVVGSKEVVAVEVVVVIVVDGSSSNGKESEVVVVAVVVVVYSNYVGKASTMQECVTYHPLYSPSSDANVWPSSSKMRCSQVTLIADDVTDMMFLVGPLGLISIGTRMIYQLVAWHIFHMHA